MEYPKFNEKEVSGFIRDIRNEIERYKSRHWHLPMCLWIHPTIQEVILSMEKLPDSFNKISDTDRNKYNLSDNYKLSYKHGSQTYHLGTRRDTMFNGYCYI